VVGDTASERAAAIRLAVTGDIRSAIGSLRTLAEASDDPEDRLLLGTMAFLATDYTEAQAQLEHAYREFQARGMPRRAAAAGTALGRLYFDGLEDQVVGRGWLARSLSLLENEGPCVERGYVVLGLMGASVASAMSWRPTPASPSSWLTVFRIGTLNARHSATPDWLWCLWAVYETAWRALTKPSP
jgi:hypothetical protein